MTRFLHAIGIAGGISMVAVPAVTDVLPTGGAKATVQIVGVVIAALAQIAKAFGRPAA
jgi:hypothetical protein